MSFTTTSGSYTVRTGSGVGSTVGTAELESPERAQDHFSASPTDQTASRVGNTGYQNTNSTARLVVISGSALGDTTSLDVASDAAFTSPVKVATFVSVAGDTFCAVGMVPPAWYYRFRRDSGAAFSGTIARWTEANL